METLYKSCNECGALNAMWLISWKVLIYLRTAWSQRCISACLVIDILLLNFTSINSHMYTVSMIVIKHGENKRQNRRIIDFPHLNCHRMKKSLMLFLLELCVTILCWWWSELFSGSGSSQSPAASNKRASSRSSSAENDLWNISVMLFWFGSWTIIFDLLKFHDCF